MLKKPQSQYALEVSVPSRGVRYLNRFYSLHYPMLLLVSVPSRGIRYLNVNIDKNTRLKLGFRPLTGIKVSELKRKNRIYVCSVSVPSRGVRYLNRVYLRSYYWYGFSSPHGE